MDAQKIEFLDKVAYKEKWFKILANKNMPAYPPIPDEWKDDSEFMDALFLFTSIHSEYGSSDHIENLSDTTMNFCAYFNSDTITSERIIVSKLNATSASMLSNGRYIGISKHTTDDNELFLLKLNAVVHNFRTYDGVLYRGEEDTTIGIIIGKLMYDGLSFTKPTLWIMTDEHVYPPRSIMEAYRRYRKENDDYGDAIFFEIVSQRDDTIKQYYFEEMENMIWSIKY